MSQIADRRGFEAMLADAQARYDLGDDSLAAHMRAYRAVLTTTMPVHEMHQRRAPLHNNWRMFVPAGVCAAWPTLTRHERALVAVMAEMARILVMEGER